MDTKIKKNLCVVADHIYINDHCKIRIARTYSDSIVGFVLHHLSIISLDIWRPAMKKRKDFPVSKILSPFA